ncbi:MAG: T9SS type A sorting domain-containing protein [Bacteroidales bacterium]|nr:T9SS type A sorting domain-containing protein [Bacteroidales bacterium]
MKTRLLILILLLTGVKSYLFAQIEMEFEHSKGIYGPVKLSHSGWKYVDQSDIDKNEIRLYNLDNTLFKTLTLPPKIEGHTPVISFYISETLFDTDSSNIEFLLVYYLNDTDPVVRIAGEDGTILLEEENASTYEIFTTGRYYYSIYETDEGAKLQLRYISNGAYYKTRVFSLPGKYPDEIEYPKVALKESDFVLFPNPSDGLNSIKLDPGRSYTGGSIQIFNEHGVLLRHVEIEPGRYEYTIDNSDLSPGTYLYQVFSPGSISALSAKKVLIVR